DCAVPGGTAPPPCRRDRRAARARTRSPAPTRPTRPTRRPARPARAPRRAQLPLREAFRRSQGSTAVTPQAPAPRASRDAAPSARAPRRTTARASNAAHAPSATVGELGIERHPAVHVQAHPVHVIGFVGGEPDCGLPDIVGLADSLVGDE